MIEKWSIYLHTVDYGRAHFTDLSKAFDRIDQQLLIAKLNAYGVDTNLLYFLPSTKEQR